MSTPINLQKPLNVNGQQIYPPTTSQQVLMKDGRRLDAWLDGKYTLVHKVVTTTDVWSLIYNPDNAKKVYISLTTPQGEETTGSIRINENSIPIVYYDKMVTPNSSWWSKATIYVENGMLCAKDMLSIEADSDESKVAWENARGFKHTHGGTFVEGITKIAVTPASKALPAGTTLEIYEVK